MVLQWIIPNIFESIILSPSICNAERLWQFGAHICSSVLGRLLWAHHGTWTVYLSVMVSVFICCLSSIINLINFQDYFFFFIRFFCKRGVEILFLGKTSVMPSKLWQGKTFSLCLMTSRARPDHIFRDTLVRIVILFFVIIFFFNASDNRGGGSAHDQTGFGSLKEHFMSFQKLVLESIFMVIWWTNIILNNLSVDWCSRFGFLWFIVG